MLAGTACLPIAIAQCNGMRRHRTCRLVVVLDAVLRDLNRRRRFELVQRVFPKDLTALCGQAAAGIGAVRASLVHYNTAEEIEEAADRVIEKVRQLRALAPVNR